MKRFIILITIIMCMLIVGCKSVVVRENITVSATISKMQYEDSYTWYNPALKMVQYFPEEYLVTISYGDISKTFDDQTLYQKVKEGDTIEIILCKEYDKNGNLLRQTLQLPE